MAVRVILSGLAALGMVLAVGCTKKEAAPMPPRPPVPVTATKAESRDVPLYIDEIGRTVPSELVNITPQVAGQIMSRSFTDGQTLTKGQQLFVIDERPYQAKVAEAEANVMQAKAQLELTQADYNRIKKAFGVQAASQEDLDTKQAALDTSNAQVKVTAAALDTAKLNLSYCTISSPINGRAGQRLVDVGNVVKANETNLLTVQNVAPLYVDFTITERDLPAVRKLSDAGELQSLISLPQTPDVTRTGPLTFIDSSVQPGAGRIRMQATLPNADHYLWPGQFVNVRLVLQTLKGAVVVPYAATQMGQKGAYVYIVKADSTAEQRPITMGQRQGLDVVIEKGVDAGETVILTGQMSVTPGGPVSVVQPVALPPGSGAPESPADVVTPQPENTPATGPAPTGGAQ